MAQRLSEADLKYMTDNLLPLLRHIGASQGGDAEEFLGHTRSAALGANGNDPAVARVQLPEGDRGAAHESGCCVDQLGREASHGVSRASVAGTRQASGKATELAINLSTTVYYVGTHVA